MLIFKMFGKVVQGESFMKNTHALNAILNRASTRNFDKDRKVSEIILKEILLAGIRAPSAGNIQPRTFIVVNDAVVKARLYELCENQAFMNNAPIWIVICLDLHRHLKAAKLTGVEYDFTGVLPYSFGILDAALSLENMVIATEALGLGSVIVGSVIEHPEKVKEILVLPEHCLALSILCIGYAKKKVERREKWNYKVMVCKNAYSDIDEQDVSEYWKRFMASDFECGGKKMSKEKLEEICKERNYGKSYSNHYKEEFIRATNEKLMLFLEKQGVLKIRGKKANG